MLTHSFTLVDRFGSGRDQEVLGRRIGRELRIGRVKDFDDSGIRMSKKNGNISADLHRT